MCRVYGHFDARVSPQELRTVSAMQRHGGPDAQSSSRGTGWALGNNRLAIVDMEGGQQPYDFGGQVKVVFNGEIYNHDALRSELVRKGHTFADRCDGSVLPALYVEYGLDFVSRLDGMFAIAVMDLRNDPTLVLATDDIGMKPLYYQWDPVRRQLHFASEIPALLSFRGVDASTWLPGLDAYLSTKTPFGDQTMFDSIRAAPPGATIVVGRANGLRIRRRSTAVEPLAGIEMREAGAEVHSLLRREVGRLVRADVPVSVVTSGGLDSSFVTALAADSVPGVHSFNIAYRGTWPHDERGFARLVAERAGTTHHQVEIDPATFPDLLPEVAWHLGQPNADPITLSTYALFAAVHEAGFKVALTGDAADELFGGYDRIKAAMATPEGADWVRPYVDALAAVPAAMRHRLYSKDYRRFIAENGTSAHSIERELRASRLSRLDTLTGFEVGSRLPAYHLRRVDHLSMASAVEVRLPFCQPAVARLAHALPASLRVRGDIGKAVLYEAARGHLPDSVLNRPKQPFTLPITAMLRPGERLFEYAQEVLCTDNLRRHGLLDRAAVRGLVAEQADRPSGAAAGAIWALMIFELWIDQVGMARRSPIADLAEATL